MRLLLGATKRLSRSPSPERGFFFARLLPGSLREPDSSSPHGKKVQHYGAGLGFEENVVRGG
jgi:hypothetical protein